MTNFQVVFAVLGGAGTAVFLTAAMVLLTGGFGARAGRSEPEPEPKPERDAGPAAAEAVATTE